MHQKTAVGILGATGIVGQRFIQMLEHHPWFEVAWLAASERSEGRPYAQAARWRMKTGLPERVARMAVSPATPDGAPKVIFAALDAAAASELEPRFAEAGCAVISNSSALRMKPDVPLVIPEVNAQHVKLIECQAWHSISFTCWALTSGITSGTSGFMRRALELEMTAQPASAKRGSSSLAAAASSAAKITLGAPSGVAGETAILATRSGNPVFMRQRAACA